MPDSHRAAILSRVLLLKVCAHLMPASEQRTRRADAAPPRRPGSMADGPQTAQEIIGSDQRT
ncbi:hypothetical protein [Nonomuraea sp. NPDC002799]